MKRVTKEVYTLYEKESGKAVNFIHAIDAKESLAGGFYVSEDPNAKKAVKEEAEEVITEIKEEEKQEPNQELEKKPEPKIIPEAKEEEPKKIEKKEAVKIPTKKIIKK